jgi:hypothetical protein
VGIAGFEREPEEAVAVGVIIDERTNKEDKIKQLHKTHLADKPQRIVHMRGMG